LNAEAFLTHYPYRCKGLDKKCRTELLRAS